MPELLDYSGYATKVRGLGPGERVVLWTRGCTIGCPGCMTTDLWAKGEPREISPLVDEILPYLAECDGLSISGGEPFQQPLAVAELVRQVRAKLDTHVLCYSGYAIEKLRQSEEQRQLLACLDVLIDGPYRKEASNTKPWRGSDNQRLHPLSVGAAGRDVEASEEDKRELQFQRLADGAIRIIGIPRRKEMEAIKEAFASRGLVVKGIE